MSRCWLMKTEPGSFSMKDLECSPGQTTMWDGVRNYQARNFMRDEMRLGDPVLFYHSGKSPGIAGFAEVASAAYPDPTQWAPGNSHYDPSSTHEEPRWWLVDIRLTRQFSQMLTLAFLRARPELVDMELLKKGSRLSIQPVSDGEYAAILELAKGL